MKTFDAVGQWCGGQARFMRAAAAALWFAALLLFAGLAQPAHAQTGAAGDRGSLSITAGATASGEYLQYGERKLLGVAGFVDADTRRRLGIEAEGRWEEYYQKFNVHIETYSVGARYHFTLGRLQPYAKGLIGFGDFNFPYNLATGRYLVATGGAGLDLRVGRRIQIRAADVEYQYWPQFTFGPMTTLSASFGLRVQVLGAAPRD
jgi:Outer membrane protein beta-barrel domain